MSKQAKWMKLVRRFIHETRARSDVKTEEWYRARLKWFVRFAAERKLKPGNVATWDLDRFFTHLIEEGLKFKTRKGTLTAAKAFFGWLYRDKERRRKFKLKKDPFGDFKPLKEETDDVEPIPLPYAYQMIRAAEADKSLAGIRDAAIMRLLLTTGARREEVAMLKLENVNLVTNQIKLVGKYNKARPSFLKPTTREALERWLDHRPKTTDEALFVTLQKGGRQEPFCEMRPGAINHLLMKWRNRAGLPPVSVSPHKWRHLFATEMARGQDPFRLQLLMGHEDISTTSDYVHNQPEILRELVMKYAPDVPNME